MNDRTLAYIYLTVNSEILESVSFFFPRRYREREIFKKKKDV